MEREGDEFPRGHLLSHHAGTTPEGFCVIETWGSREALQRFLDAELGAALDGADIQVQPMMLEIINFL